MGSAETDWFSEFNKLIAEHSDQRTKDWPLIRNPSVLIVSIIAYLYFVCVYGPRYMKERKPYNLKKIITVYNLGQIAACTYLFHGYIGVLTPCGTLNSSVCQMRSHSRICERHPNDMMDEERKKQVSSFPRILRWILNAGWMDEYSLGCQPVDRSLNPKAYRMARLVWWTMILKISEFSETIFFVLRKKYNQISGLHLYHHVSTLIIGWLCCKFTPGGMTTFPILVNCLVHIVMYAYYLIALHGGRELQMKVQNWKKAITLMQMAQFIIIVAHSMSALRSDCNVPNVITYIFAPNIFLLYYMFYKFYQTTYNNKNK